MCNWVQFQHLQERTAHCPISVTTIWIILYVYSATMFFKNRYFARTAHYRNSSKLHQVVVWTLREEEKKKVCILYTDTASLIFLWIIKLQRQFKVQTKYLLSFEKTKTQYVEQYGEFLFKVKKIVSPLHILC